MKKIFLSAGSVLLALCSYTSFALEYCHANDIQYLLDSEDPAAVDKLANHCEYIDGDLTIRLSNNPNYQPKLTALLWFEGTLTIDGYDGDIYDSREYAIPEILGYGTYNTGDIYKHYHRVTFKNSTNMTSLTGYRGAYTAYRLNIRHFVLEDNASLAHLGGIALETRVFPEISKDELLAKSVDEFKSRTHISNGLAFMDSFTSLNNPQFKWLASGIYGPPIGFKSLGIKSLSIINSPRFEAIARYAYQLDPLAKSSAVTIHNLYVEGPVRYNFSNETSLLVTDTITVKDSPNIIHLYVDDQLSSITFENFMAGSSQLEGMMYEDVANFGRVVVDGKELTGDKITDYIENESSLPLPTIPTFPGGGLPLF